MKSHDIPVEAGLARDKLSIPQIDTLRVLAMLSIFMQHLCLEMERELTGTCAKLSYKLANSQEAY